MRLSGTNKEEGREERGRIGERERRNKKRDPETEIHEE
jgi:hypothetical protein